MEFRFFFFYFSGLKILHFLQAIVAQYLLFRFFFFFPCAHPCPELNGKPTRHSKRLAAKRRETEVDSASKENHCLDQSDATNIPNKRPDSSVISNSITHPIPPPAPPLPPLLTHHRNTRKSKTANPTGSSAPQSTFDGYDQENDESVAGTSCGHLSNSAGPADKSDRQVINAVKHHRMKEMKKYIVL